MNIALLLFVFALLSVVSLSTVTTTVNDSTNITQHNSTKIIPVQNSSNIILTFGSCNSFWDKEPGTIFEQVVDLTPDVWVWVGDAAFTDFKEFPTFFCKEHEDCVKRTFSIAKNMPTYAALRNSTRVIGTWNDHDYGRTDGGKKYPQKNVMQRLWLDFMDEPQESPRRTRNGIYESYYLDDMKKVKIILLDARFNRDEKKAFALNDDLDILGDEQWLWLENELKGNQAEFIVIASGSQILPDDRLVPDSWSTKSRDKLVGLIKKYKVGGVVLLSGDVMYAEMMKHPCKERVGFELHEFTSSGLTQSILKKALIANMFLGVAYPHTWNTGSKDMYFEKNFGVLNFEFGENKGVRFQARNEQGIIVLEKFIPYSDLEFNEAILDDKSSCELDKKGYVRFFEHYWQLFLNGTGFVYFILGGLLGALALFGLMAYACIKLIIIGMRAIKEKRAIPEKVKTE